MAREKKVLSECEWTLTDRWSQHAVCFDGWGTKSVNIHGTPPSTSFSCFSKAQGT